MPRRRKSRKRSRQFAFRTGKISASGGKPIIASTRGFTTVCAGSLTTMVNRGSLCAFELTGFDAPCDPVGGVSGNNTFNIKGSDENHPNGHEELVADGYQAVQVYSKFFRFDIRFRGSDLSAQDFVFAYKFNAEATIPMDFSTELRAIDNWKDLRQSRGWVWKQMSATHSGGSIHPSAARVEVKVPNVRKLTKALQTATLTSVTSAEEYKVVLNDAGVNNSTKRAFLWIACFTIDGIPFGEEAVQIDTTIYMKCRAFRDFGKGQMIEEAGQVLVDTSI